MAGLNQIKIKVLNEIQFSRSLAVLLTDKLIYLCLQTIQTGSLTFPGYVLHLILL